MNNVITRGTRGRILSVWGTGEEETALDPHWGFHSAGKLLVLDGGTLAAWDARRPGWEERVEEWKRKVVWRQQRSGRTDGRWRQTNRARWREKLRPVRSHLCWSRKARVLITAS